MERPESKSEKKGNRFLKFIWGLIPWLAVLGILFFVIITALELKNELQSSRNSHYQISQRLNTYSLRSLVLSITKRKQKLSLWLSA